HSAELIGRRARVVAEDAQRIAGLGGPPDDQAGKHLTQWMKLKFEARDDAESPSAPPQAVEELRILRGRGAHEASVGQHDAGREEVVDREPMPAHEPARAAAERETADARAGNQAAGRRETGA